MTKKVEYLEIRVRQLQETINVSNAAKAGLMRERDQALAREAKLREVLEPIVDEFVCTIEQYYKIGPDFTHKDGTEVFIVQTVLDREPLITVARAALKEGQDHD